MISAKLSRSTAARALAALAAFAMIAIAGCQQTPPLTSAPADAGTPGKDQQVFDSSDQAVAAVLAAAKAARDKGKK